MKIGIGSNHDAFANYIFGKYKRAGEYACSGISLTFLQPKQDEGTKESSVHIAYRLMLQELYFLTHNTIFVNQKEILQGIKASVVRQLELVRKESRTEAVRMESLIRQIRETKDSEQLLRIEHEIENRLGINIVSTRERMRGTENQAAEQTVKVTNMHNAVIDRYFERMQSAIVWKTPIQTNRSNTQEAVLEQQRKLLSEVYAESTEQEKREFASYLVERQLLYKLEDRAVKELKMEQNNYIVQDNYIVHKVMKELETNLTREITEQITKELEMNQTKEITQQATNELGANPTKEIIEQISKELEENLTKETAEQKIKEFETNLTEEITKQVTKVLEANLTKEIAEQKIKEFETNLTEEITKQVTKVLEASLTKEIAEQKIEELGANLIKEIIEQVTKELETNLTKETTEQKIKELETNLTKEITKQVTSEIEKFQDNKSENNIKEDIFENELADYQGKNQTSEDYAEQTMRITDNTFADAVKNKAAKVSEMLQTVNEMQFQELQQVFMEAYEKQQLSRLAETEELQLNIGTGLTHIQKNLHNTVIDRYFARLQSAMVSEAYLLTKKANVQETVFEQQRNLLSRIYAESTEQEKEAFASYLEERHLLYKKDDQAIKERKIDQNSSIVHAVMNELETNLTKEITERVTEEFETNLTKGITEQVTEELETNLTKEITEQVTKELETNLAKKTASQVTSTDENNQGSKTKNKIKNEIDNKTETVFESELVNSRDQNQISIEDTEQPLGKVMRITDNAFADVLKNKVKKVSKMLQTINETQFQELQQVFMEAYERQRLSQFAEIEERQIGIETRLTHIQKKLHNSIIQRYFEELQSMLVSESVQTKKTNPQQAMFALQRALLSRIYEESTEQEREEFVSYLEENSLIYKTADKTGKDDGTRLVNEMSDQITREVETRLSRKITNRASDQVTREFKVNLTSKAEKHIFRERTDLHHFIINRYLNRLQSMLMSGSVQTETSNTQEMVFHLHRNILNKVYTESRQQEKKEFVSGLELSYLAAKRKKEDSQASETKIQEIVERCVKHATRITENENVRRQMNDQRDEIVQLKTQVQKQQEEMSAFLRNSSRVLNMDRMYQEIEKRMESRLHLERLRRGM